MRPVHPKLTALRTGAALSILRILAVTAAILTGISAVTFDESLLLAALVLVPFSVLVVVASFVAATSVKCTHCRSQLFAPLSLPKHPKAKSFLRSHLIEMSLDILLGTSFRCIYCGECCGCRRHTSDTHRRPSGTSAAKQRIQTLNPSARSVSTVLSRNPAASMQAPRFATHVPNVSATRAPVPAHSPETPRAPYAPSRQASVSPLDACNPARAPQPHHRTDPSSVA